MTKKGSPIEGGSIAWLGLFPTSLLNHPVPKAFSSVAEISEGGLVSFASFARCCKKTTPFFGPLIFSPP